MPTEVSAFEVIYGSVLLLGGLACFIHFLFFFGRPKRIDPEQGVPPWHIGFLPFLIGAFALVIVVMLVISFMAVLAPAEWISDGLPSQILTFGLAMHGTALLALFALYKAYPEKFAQPFVRKRMPWARAIVTALYSFLVLIPVIYPLTYAWTFLLEQAGIEPELQDAVMIFGRVDSLPILLLMIFLTVIVAPISEEIVFRGCLYRFIKAKTAIIPALIATNLIFAALHQNLLSVLPLFILGVALAYVYEKSGDLKMPILLHGFFNLNTVIVIIVTNGLV